ncbi:hypothetical protein BC629DRAFT_1441672 [Irpex lacteus]|nr:hypothetical protein BC629DRAFT_1441672 [Irpex lacteus]
MTRQRPLCDVWVNFTRYRYENELQVGALGHIMHEVASGQAGASKGVKRATRGSRRPMGYPSTTEDDSTPEFAVGGVVESCDTVKGDYKESARRAAESGSASRGRIKKKRPYSLPLVVTSITLPRAITRTATAVTVDVEERAVSAMVDTTPPRTILLPLARREVAEMGTHRGSTQSLRLVVADRIPKRVLFTMTPRTTTIVVAGDPVSHTATLDTTILTHNLGRVVTPSPSAISSVAGSEEATVTMTLASSSMSTLEPVDPSISLEDPSTASD